MRNIAPLVVLGLALFSAGRACASERDDALDILGKAVKAHGGEEALGKAAQLTRTGSGAITIFDNELPFTDELTVALPQRFRFTLEVTKDKQKARATLVINGDTGWQDNGGMVSELSKERLAELQAEAYVQWVSLVVPLKKDTEFQLAPLPPTKINGRAVVGVKVARKPHPDVNLYFDADSGLLTKVARRAKESGIDVQKDAFFDEYKEVDGVKLPFHVVETLNEKKFTELKVGAYKLIAKPDDKLFGKP